MTIQDLTLAELQAAERHLRRAIRNAHACDMPETARHFRRRLEVVIKEIRARLDK